MNFKEFASELENYSSDEICFISLGNEFRGDDAIGSYLAGKIKKLPRFLNSTFIFAGTNPENYFDKILDSRARLICFLDACNYGGNTGELSWLNESDIENLGFSTHTFSIKLIEKFLCLFRKFDFKFLIVQPLGMNPFAKISDDVITKVDSFFDLSSEPNLK